MYYSFSREGWTLKVKMTWQGNLIRSYCIAFRYILGCFYVLLTQNGNHIMLHPESTREFKLQIFPIAGPRISSIVNIIAGNFFKVKIFKNQLCLYTFHQNWLTMQCYRLKQRDIKKILFSKVPWISKI